MMEKMWMSFVLMIMITAMGIIAHASKEDFENSLVEIGGIGESDRSYLLREKRGNKKQRSKKRRNNSNRGQNRNRGENEGDEEDDQREREREPPKRR